MRKSKPGSTRQTPPTRAESRAATWGPGATDHGDEYDSGSLDDGDKRAKGSEPLSHLFSQGLISAQSLVAGPSAVLERFVTIVAALSRGRILPTDFKPKKVVFAILMENGKQLSPDTLFPFSQATLAHAASVLGTYGIDVEVIGIPAA